MTIGEYYELKIAREVDFGVYLESDLGDILLPKKYLPEDYKVDDYLDVFLYKDSEDRLIATTLRPAGKLNDFVALEVKDSSPFGAFLEWGLEKDLFVPKNEQPYPYQIGDKVVVKICLDHRSDRLIGVGKLRSFFSKDIEDLTENEEVNLLIYNKSDLGYEAVVNQSFTGLIYKNDVQKELNIGEELIGYIHHIREDGKIDLRLNQVGVKAIDENTTQLLNLLKENGGVIPVTDKSSPEDIVKYTGLSKKAFKKAVGGLYKQRLIKLNPDEIRLVSS